MRTNIEIFKKHSHATMATGGPHLSTEYALAAMKEAQEEYFIALTDWWRKMDWSKFNSYYIDTDKPHEERPDYKKLFEDFNAHLAEEAQKKTN